MMKVLKESCAIALIFSSRTSLIDCAIAISNHQVRIRRALEVNGGPLVLFVSRTQIVAHDFDGGPKRRVLGNGTLKAIRDATADSQ